jgi:hypothetical protein
VAEKPAAKAVPHDHDQIPLLGRGGTSDVGSSPEKDDSRPLPDLESISEPKVRHWTRNGVPFDVPINSGHADEESVESHEEDREALRGLIEKKTYVGLVCGGNSCMITDTLARSKPSR